MSKLERNLGNDQQSAFATVASAALESAHVLRTSAGKVFKIFGRLDSTAPTATYYIQLFNRTSAPADATATTATFPAPIKIIHTQGTSDTFSFDFEGSGLWCSVGCYICLSSTEFTKTLSGDYLSLTALVPFV